jgi:hypothetical protein
MQAVLAHNIPDKRARAAGTVLKEQDEVVADVVTMHVEGRFHRTTTVHAAFSRGERIGDGWSNSGVKEVGRRSGRAICQNKTRVTAQGP